MKSILPLLTLVLLFASCTTAYKSGQTPDDVYYSPARPQQPHDEYVRAESRQPKYQYDEATDDDRYLRMKVRNRRTWSDLDYYYSDPYAYNYHYNNRYNNSISLYYNTPWNYYSSWNYYYNPYSYYNPYGTFYSYNFNPVYGYNPYYNPYGSKVIIVNPRPPVYNRPRTFNLNVYNPPQNNGFGKSGSRRSYGGDNGNYNYNNNYGSNSNRGNGLRNIFGNSNSGSSNNSSYQQSTPSRSNSTPSTSSPSRSSNAPVRKF